MKLGSTVVEPQPVSLKGPHRRGPVGSSIVTAVLAAVVVGLVFIGGQRRGMDHLTETYSAVQWTIAVALSDSVYDLNAGYLGYATVLDKLGEVWNGAEQNEAHETLAEKKENADILDGAIAAAASLGSQQPSFIEDRTLITLVFSDLGYVNFVKLAFGIFGLNIESFYYTFFLVLSLSAIAYLVVFWSDPLAKIVLLVTLFAFLIELNTTIFSHIMPTFAGMRHCSALALIPLWHFTLLVIYGRRPTLITILAALIQLAILLFAIQIRSSAGWSLIFVVAVSLVFTGLSRRTLKEGRSLQWIWLALARWPVALLIGGLLLGNEYTKATLHPVYFTDDVNSYHGIWHTTYLGILIDAPELIPQDSKAMELWNSGGVDSAAYVAAAEYLDDIHFMHFPSGFPESLVPSGYVSPWTGTLKMRLDEEIMKRIVIRLATEHPIGMLQLYLYTKPISIIRNVFEVITEAPSFSWLWLLVIGGTLAFRFTLAAGRAVDDLQPSRALRLVGSAVPFAALPNILGYPAPHTMADLLLVVLAFLQILICVTAIVIMRSRSKWAGVVTGARPIERTPAVSS